MSKMKSLIIKIKPDHIELDKIKIIAKVLKEEGVIAYPTDTFYGLGANSFSKKATEKIYGLKTREASKPLSVVMADIEMVKRMTSSLPDKFWILSREFWPGALTLVLKAKPLFPPKVLGPGGSLAVRIPNLPWLRELIRQADFPITATSANISGEKEVNEPEKIIKIFSHSLDLIVDGGKTPGALPSTVVDITSEEPRVIREGAIALSQLEKYLKS